MTEIESAAIERIARNQARMSVLIMRLQIELKKRDQDKQRIREIIREFLSVLDQVP